MLVGNHITLRGFELSDAPAILEHFNDLEARQFLDAPAPHSKEQEEHWIRQTWEARRSGRGHFYAIERVKPQKLIGGCGLFSLSKIHRSAELMIVIYDKHNREKGLGTEAVQLLLEFGFKTLNLHRIYLRAFAFNTRAINLYGRLGFVEEGRLREAVFKDGEYHDEVRMAMLAREWPGR